MAHLIFMLLPILIATTIKADEISTQQHDLEITDLAEELDSRLLLFSTLNGYLYGIEQDTGNIRWKIKDRAIIKVPKDGSIIPIFLPDPRDGSLYLIGSGKDRLKKLPFKIPELVTSSPCRSSDGILYTGKKKDTWFLLDPNTGKRQHVLGWDNSQAPTCPVQSPDAIFIGRTEYSLMMVDSKHSDRKWNVTFNEYSSASPNKDLLANYELVHFSSSSTGLLYTLDRRRATILWDKHLDSPVVAIYILDPDGLISVPFTSLSNQTLNNFALNLIENDINQQNPMKLYPTLYVGEHMDGFYALPSFVDQNMVTISNSDGKPLMLEGPDGATIPYYIIQYPLPGNDYPMPNSDVSDDVMFQSIPSTVIYLGHYEIPQYIKTKLQITGNSHTLTHLITDESGNRGVRTDPIVLTRRTFIINAFELVVLVTLFTIVFYVCYNYKTCVQYVRRALYYDGDSSTSTSNSNSSTSSSGGKTTGEVVPELYDDDGLMRIGKICFDSQYLLGKGCDGTFVYRGEFEGRRVAVKRLLPECFNFANREVDLLRESDAHPNVVRYFCTEQDKMFKYIALELGQATLYDYVNGSCPNVCIAREEILQQATSGLAHLHSLNIVHRDIKPQNVLLSMAGPDGRVRAMISDFGLSKKLQIGRMSFSRRSGVAGTDGWIAPEMLNEQESTTCAVDMFSLGCLFYYVLSDGQHPFGDSLRRQANISLGEFILDALKDEEWRNELHKPLITQLIASDPKQRPACANVLNHPIFWSNTKILTFLQDVSDRVEKSDLTDPALVKLEGNGYVVARGDWRSHIDDELSADLRKYRSYRGESLRDLLRALRNKKHHFHELSQESRDCLGDIPDKFTMYWTRRFPLLVVHTWLTMQILASEETFKQYYSTYHYALELLDYAAHASDDVIKLFNSAQVLAQEEYANKMQRKMAKAAKYKHKHENVGLYRNVNAEHKSAGDSHETTTTRVPRSDHNNGKGRKKTTTTQKRTDDVPLKWIVSQGTTNGKIT